MNMSSIKKLIFRKTLTSYPVIIVCTGKLTPVVRLRSGDYENIDNIKYVDTAQLDIHDIDSKWKFVFFAEVKGIDKQYVKDYITITIDSIECKVDQVVFV